MASECQHPEAGVPVFAVNVEDVIVKNAALCFFLSGLIGRQKGNHASVGRPLEVRDATRRRSELFGPLIVDF
jgi:hypothetical protein